ncbi:hypothetical protein MNBD_NITROSPINAE04-1241 [hydrothermal vent metagenome]|uniref:Uncharacterized protein n=1 Tax=hydrothermal vent metagenome TaxID=652676 RepID=A0A3B1CAL2_9ZZZZ
MRKALFGLALLFFSLSWPHTAFSYGYAEAEDEMVIIFREGLIAASEGNWDLARKKSKEGISAQKGHLFEADKLGPEFNVAIEKKDTSKTAELFANLVYISIREKLYRCMRDGLKDFKNNKARLGLARKSYIDALDGNVKKQDPKKSEAILKQFDIALEAVGNPGLFGVGARQADPEGFEKAVNNIDKQIMLSFPRFFQGSAT